MQVPGSAATVIASQNRSRAGKPLKKFQPVSRAQETSLLLFWSLSGVAVFYFPKKEGAHIPGFEKYHPATCFLFFAAVLGITMSSYNPVLLALSFLGAFSSLIVFKGVKFAAVSLRALLFSAVFMTAVNFLFNGAGTTVLFVTASHRAFTLESLVFGFVSWVLFASVAMWFIIFAAVMTDEKLFFMFGKQLPSFTMILSMSLAFLPSYTSKYREAKEAAFALSGEPVGRMNKLRLAFEIFSATAGRVLESTVTTADSMNARGYGSGERTRYSRFKFARRDKAAAVLILGTAVPVIFAGLSGALVWEYFPKMTHPAPGAAFFAGTFAFFVLAFLPVITHFLEEARWNSLRQNI